MKLKVLITGRNKKVMADISERLEEDRGYDAIKCAPSKEAIFDLTLSELPKIIIICLGDETADTVRIYDVMKSAVKQGNCTVIVIANQEDEKFFMNNTALEKVLFISRPVSLFALYEKLAELEEKIKKNKENNLASFREFVNDRPDARFRRKSILVVDDDSEQLMNIKEQLEEFYDLTLVKSGDKAFVALTKKIPDLILLDYLMPDMNGPQVLSELRSTQYYADIPVVFLTSMSDRGKVLQTIKELRPQGYIIKPAKKADLVAKIINVLG